MESNEKPAQPKKPTKTRQDAQGDWEVVFRPYPQGGGRLQATKKPPDKK